MSKMVKNQSDFTYLGPNENSNTDLNNNEENNQQRIQKGFSPIKSARRVINQGPTQGANNSGEYLDEE